MDRVKYVFDAARGVDVEAVKDRGLRDPRHDHDQTCPEVTAAGRLISAIAANT